jgi:hypothetical protein
VNNEEAAGLLESELAGLRAESYASLVQRISQPALTFERAGPSGTKYQLELQVLWDGRPGSNVRVMGSIDDGRWRAFIPLSRDFIKSPDGSFVGE